MADRTLPHNLDAEKSVIGAILINNHAFNQAAEVIDAHDFFRDAHRRIFEKIVGLTDRNEPVDLVTLMGNGLIILVTWADPMLHSPMYFFLRNLSFLEIGFNLVIVPKMLGTLMAQDTAISFLGCAAQMYFFFFFGVSECFLLATMAYDRYVAICHPLRYPVIMNPRTRARLAVAPGFQAFL